MTGNNHRLILRGQMAGKRRSARGLASRPEGTTPPVKIITAIHMEGGRASAQMGLAGAAFCDGS